MQLSLTENDNQPLADRIRPKNMTEFIGQPQLRERVDAFLRANRLPSLLFFGPPGCGKSTLALLLAQATGRPFVRVSAPEAGLPVLRKKLAGHKLLILDELHRFSKAQQDFFLPGLENGTITLIATTTENPSFSITRQLLSRLHVLRFRPLSHDELLDVAKRGESELGDSLTDAAREYLCGISGGDARSLLNLLEYALGLPEESRTPEHLAKNLPEVIIRGDRGGDSHYELASALIKSIRGSDPDAALYYLACLLESGEDPRFVTRRLMISASEDVGLADPQALPMAVSCHQSVEAVGMPEGRIPMAETVVYLALAPKSNSTYAAYATAQKEVRQNGVQPVPLHLRNASTSLQKEWGYGRNYQYPHSFPGSWVEQRYLPESLGERRFYEPKEQGAEPRLLAWIKGHLRSLRKPPRR
ncbi:putative ATPase [Paucidesulfovibrio gracilis DSM 16080]|uniref:Replication-associated recombination protein A n=1 Tax=Paucidesulfovibrio gracilis DSM 16080 TaxID=1121449 RepID=A0A1T4WN15_9BACT|nr:replication-associated recombination protein A [Paucidesulfovibrio gracilis]SKA78724.1 putative ATPase [Paucidesulfovibrio gracilis DSM 16080]